MVNYIRVYDYSDFFNFGNFFCFPSEITIKGLLHLIVGIVFIYWIRFDFN